MKKEIEYRFLVKGRPWDASAAKPRAIRQFYLVADPQATVRVRIAGNKAWLTVKGAARGASRDESECEIPLEIALRLEKYRQGQVVEKLRHTLSFQGRTWEIDEFKGANAGLAICELEVSREDESFSLPPFAGREITGDHRYSNLQLALHPFSQWPAEERE